MPRRPRPSNDTDEDRWKNAKNITFEDLNHGLQVQVHVQVAAGLDSSTGTCFARLLSTDESKSSSSSSSSPSIQQVVEQVLHLRESTSSDSVDCETLWRLGAVWILDIMLVDRPQNRPKWYRWTNHNESLTTHKILRIHSRPTRFIPNPSDWNIAHAIVHHDLTNGFVILNKPDGLPSHGTVDNAVENMLSYFQSYHATISSFKDESTYTPSLPHRLDTDTSGLLLIATRQSFAIYASNLFQQRHIQKHYRCLLSCPTVECWKNLMELYQSNTIVTHFLDSNSSAAPKKFETHRPSEKSDSWLECQLRLLSVDPPRIWKDTRVCQVQVELLTGRTHQIRGQMASLGCPIVGDALYGTLTHSSATDQSLLRLRGANIQNSRSTPRMALQCCQLAFALPPDSSIHEPFTNKQQQQQQQRESVVVHLDHAWWSNEFSQDSEELIEWYNDP